MTETEFVHIHSSKYHYWVWAIKFYIRNPSCLYRDLWWLWMPGTVVRFNSTVDWNRSDFERWLWNNVGIKNVSWGLRIDDWVKGKSFDFVIKFRIGKTARATQLALMVR